MSYGRNSQVGKVFCHGFVSGLSLQNRVKSPEKTFQQVTSFLPENVFMAMILCSLGYPSEYTLSLLD
jgi:hypothetical protein